MITILLLGIIAILYFAGMYLMAAFVPYVEHSAEQEGHQLRTGWKAGLLVGWPIAVILEALITGKQDD